MKERVLPDDYPMYYGYYYLADNQVIQCNKFDFDVGRWKTTFKVKEIKSCDAAGRGLLKGVE
jgi:hypothetical protein